MDVLSTEYMYLYSKDKKKYNVSTVQPPQYEYGYLSSMRSHRRHNDTVGVFRSGRH